MQYYRRFSKYVKAMTSPRRPKCLGAACPRIRVVRAALGLVLFTALPAAASPYAGSAACVPCHASLLERQGSSRHADALRPILASPLPAHLAERPIRERGGVAFEYEPSEEGLVVRVSRGDRVASALLEWTFGAGSQGLTAVGRRNGRYIEHRVSFYPNRQRPAITLGHPLEPPRSARGALGLTLDAGTAVKCFNCHATAVRLGFDGPDLSVVEPGVRCERCHGPGAEHVAAAKEGRFAEAVAAIDARRAGGRDNIEFCGQCHRLPEPGERNTAPEKKDPLNVRFQPMGLLASRCFERGGELSCLTCHDPHENAQTDAAYYVAKCVGCHEDAPVQSSTCGRRTGENCLPCHMPPTGPTAYLTFTDHRIRVY